jgi:hypothetical protein
MRVRITADCEPGMRRNKSCLPCCPIPTCIEANEFHLKYTAQNKNLTEYETDIQRILAAFATDSKGQRDKLVKALRETLSDHPKPANEYHLKTGRRE